MPGLGLALDINGNGAPISPIEKHVQCGRPHAHQAGAVSDSGKQKFEWPLQFLRNYGCKHDVFFSWPAASAPWGWASMLSSARKLMSSLT